MAKCRKKPQKKTQSEKRKKRRDNNKRRVRRETEAKNEAELSAIVEFPSDQQNSGIPGDLDSSSFCSSLTVPPSDSSAFNTTSSSLGQVDDGNVEESSIIPPVVPGKKQEADASLVEELGSDVILPVVVEQPAEKKARKTNAANCVGGSFSSIGERPYQEVRFAVDDGCAYYAVYDGHGGEKASHYCEKHMKDYVMDRLPEGGSDADMQKAFRDAFVELDKKFLEKRYEDGTTACVAYITDNNKLYVANVGDSRAIVACADGSVVEMSQDHKPDLPSERKRIEAAYHDVVVITDVYQGKRIKIARVDGMLAVARAIGDGMMKDDMDDPEKLAVTCVPEVRNLVLDKAKHLYLVIACDGIWDVYSNQEVAQIVVGELGTERKRPIDSAELDRVAQLIVEGAIHKGSMDNCTAVVVAL